MTRRSDEGSANSRWAMSAGATPTAVLTYGTAFVVTPIAAGRCPHPAATNPHATATPTRGLITIVLLPEEHVCIPIVRILQGGSEAEHGAYVAGIAPPRGPPHPPRRAGASIFG